MANYSDFGNNGATFTWHTTPHSIIYFAVSYQKEIRELSKSYCFILLAPSTGLLCYASQINIIYMSTEIFSYEICQLEMVSQN